MCLHDGTRSVGVLLRRYFPSIKTVRLVHSEAEKPRILFTGGLGQLGVRLADVLRTRYGRDTVILSDIVEPSKEVCDSGPYLHIDVLDYDRLKDVIESSRISWLIHLSTMASAGGEKNAQQAMKVNIDGVRNVLQLGNQFKLKVFVPSSIGAFGPSSPRNPTPDITIQRPRTIYGISKVYAELMGEYYHHTFGLDFRCLRLPGIISADTHFSGGGISDYSVQIFHDALLTGGHTCYLRPDCRLPFMYIDDFLRCIVEYLEIPGDQLSMRTYNINAMSFTPEELSNELRKHVPHLEMKYKPDSRQAIADTWAMKFDDSNARKDWGWKHEYNIEDMCTAMVRLLKPTYTSKQGKTPDKSKPNLKLY
ncbi:L-threonine 3-dehydrogenase, mitochondrial-like [Tubulanus polymorphus]|uniref:L-threonine 3-dehydrogenase, mitochondrial-like n=1 Tax=Tubulanus polymorphus TaxID=672921 RepID=UPI003DA29BA9